MNRVAGIVVLALLLGLPIGVVAGPVGDARKAYKAGDYATALCLLRGPAENGVAAAQSGLGVMYGLGKGVARNDREAVKWYRRAAAQGLRGAQYILGRMM